LSQEELDGLIQRARNRDPAAVATLFERFYPKVLRYMRYRVPPAHAEDLAGEAFFRVLRGLSDQQGSFRAWLFTIARNLVLDHRKSAKVRLEQPLTASIADDLKDDNDPAAIVEQGMDIEEALRDLTEEQQELLDLKFHQGLSNAEIGAVTGRSPEAVRGLQFRALSALRDVLETGRNRHAR